MISRDEGRRFGTGRWAVSAAVLAIALGVVAGAAQAQQQQHRVTGRVVDAEGGAPIPAATVLATGTPYGTQTTDSGTFAFLVPANVTSLTVRRIGFHQKVVPIQPGEVPEVTVTLTKDVLQLETQVVTGVATTISSQNSANAVAVVNTDEINRVPSPTLENALQAKIPGAIIETNNGGAPGGGLQIQIRGITSIEANASPLYVIDGVILDNQTINSGADAITGANDNHIYQDSEDNSPNRLADLNPNDIESIEVLKGASASAIYGAKAASGVVVITTKKGEPGRAKWDVVQRVGTFTPANTLDFRSFPTLASAEAWGANIGKSAAFISSVYTGNHDFQQELFGGGELSYETDVSVRGSTESGNTNYYLSGLTKYDNGLLINTGYNKQSARTNFTQNFSSAITANLNLSYTHSLTRRGITGNDNTGVAPYDAFASVPQFVNLDVQNADGTWATNPFGVANPFADAALIQTPEEVSHFVGGASIAVRPLTTESQTLQITLMGGADIAQQRDALYAPPTLQIEQAQALPGVATSSNANLNYLNFSLNAVHHFTGLSFIDLTTSAGLAHDQRSLINPNSVGQLLAPGQNSVTAAAVQSAFFYQTGQRDFSYYVQEQALALNQRLSATVGLTAQRTTNDGSIDQYFYYPKFSAAYRIPQFVGFLDELKLRAAYGRSGTEPNFGVRYTNLIQALQSGANTLYPALQVGNPNAQPETNTEIETGFDATMFSSRAQFSATVYQKRITNTLLLAGVAPSYGFSQEWLNGGEFTNQGIELSLATTPVQSRHGLTWINNLTFYRNYSVVNSLPVGPFNIQAAPLQFAGIVQFGGPFSNFQIAQGRAVSEMTNESILNAQGVGVQVGDAQPNFQMSMGNDFTVGPFQLYALLDWKYGASVADLTNAYYDNGLYLLADSVASAKRQAAAGAGLTPYVENGGYVKLREVTLTYTLPAHWFSSIAGGRINTVRLAASGRNLWSSFRYTGLDPEISNFGNEDIARNQDVTPYPPARSWFFSLELGL